MAKIVKDLGIQKFMVDRYRLTIPKKFPRDIAHKGNTNLMFA